MVLMKFPSVAFHLHLMMRQVHYPTMSHDVVFDMVSQGSTIRGGYYHNLFVFVGFHCISLLFPYFVVVASPISLLSACVPFPQSLSALQIVLLQLHTYMLSLSPNFSVSLFIVLIVFLPCVIFLLLSSLSLLFPLSFRMCRHHSYCSYCFLLPLYCRVDYYKYSCML